MMMSGSRMFPESRRGKRVGGADELDTWIAPLKGWPTSGVASPVFTYRACRGKTHSFPERAKCNTGCQNVRVVFLTDLERGDCAVIPLQESTWLLAHTCLNRLGLR